VVFTCLLLVGGRIIRKVGLFPPIYLKNFKGTGIHAGMGLLAEAFIGFDVYDPAISHKDGF